MCSCRFSEQWSFQHFAQVICAGIAIRPAEHFRVFKPFSPNAPHDINSITFAAPFTFTHTHWAQKTITWNVNRRDFASLAWIRRSKMKTNPYSLVCREFFQSCFGERLQVCALNRDCVILTAGFLVMGEEGWIRYVCNLMLHIHCTRREQPSVWRKEELRVEIYISRDPQANYA